MRSWAYLGFDDGEPIYDSLVMTPSELTVLDHLDKDVSWVPKWLTAICVDEKAKKPKVRDFMEPEFMVVGEGVGGRAR